MSGAIFRKTPAKRRIGAILRLHREIGTNQTEDTTMTLSATEFEFRASVQREAGKAGPVIDKTHWGYAIRDELPRSAARAMIAASGRFAGTILLMVAAGLLLLPDGAHAPGLLGMKLAATVMFAVFGAALLLAGRRVHHPEIHVDTIRGEVRLGRRGIKGDFHLRAVLAFDDIASVYLLRTKDHSQPTRLFLRLAGADLAIEVASGAQTALEGLRERLTRDLARDPRRPAALKVGPPAHVAA